MKDLFILGAGGFAWKRSWIVHRSGEYRIVGILDETLESGSTRDCEKIPVADSVDTHMDRPGAICDIGTSAAVLPRIREGDGAVVAARTIVTKAVSPNAMITRVPAQVIKWRR